MKVRIEENLDKRVPKEMEGLEVFVDVSAEHTSSWG